MLMPSFDPEVPNGSWSRRPGYGTRASRALFDPAAAQQWRSADSETLLDNSADAGHEPLMRRWL